MDDIRLMNAVNFIQHLSKAFVLVLAAQLCAAQCQEIVWPTDTAVAQQAKLEIARLQTTRTGKDYRNATRALTWLARNAPRADTNLYIDAERIYGELLDRERNETVKRMYLDSIYRFYDLRVRHCGKAFDVDDARALALYRHFVASKPELVRKELDSIIRKDGEITSERILLAYMESVRVEFRKYEKLKDKDVLLYYNRAMRIAELKRAHVRKLKQQEEPVMRLMDDIDAILFSMVVVDCQFVTKTLGPRFREYPDDLMLARRIISLMLQSQCIDDPLWLQAAERIYIGQDKPDFTLAKSIGIRYYSKKNYSQARYYLSEAATLAPTGTDKSEMLLLVGQIEARSDKLKARATFRRAIEADKNNKEGFERIGDLYFNSENSCIGNEKITPLLVYMLAADYYQRAGNGQKISKARERFPTKDQLKQWGYSAGQEVSVECWIQETTTIRSKN
ncbi:hypothetical protein WBG78_12905 [Chryseolinea sp. T2]|uniref:hypothetical protein n=1 Tax=Chryseolinea sp. T2 TaxID=3129255 RepID=UPI0030776AB5